MHLEYAVEPRAIASSWEKCLYLSEKFGFDKGRVLALYPKRWLAMALEEVDVGVPPKQKARIHAKLRALKRDCSIASGRNYDANLDPDPMQSWLKNALNQQSIKPFHAIIATKNLEENEFVLSITDIEETDPLMRATSDREIPSDILSLSKAFEVLLRSGTRIAFVDPFFSLYDNDYRMLLSECLKIIQQSNPKKDYEIEIHYRHGEKMPEISDLKRDAPQFIDAIPKGMNVVVYCWRQLESGEDFHDRYLITNKGGIKLGRGFKAMGSHITANLNLMNLENSRRRLDAFSINTSLYELVGEPARISHPSTSI